MLKFKEFWSHDNTFTGEKVNEWLEANPNIEIVSVNTTANSLTHSYLILYREV